MSQCQEQTDWIQAEKEWSEKCQNVVPLHPESVFFLRVMSAGSGIPFLAMLNSGCLTLFCSHCSSIKPPRIRRHTQPLHIAWPGFPTVSTFCTFPFCFSSDRWQPTPLHLFSAACVGAACLLYAWLVSRVTEAKTGLARKRVNRLLA